MMMMAVNDGPWPLAFSVTASALPVVLCACHETSGKLGFNFHYTMSYVSVISNHQFISSSQSHQSHQPIVYAIVTLPGQPPCFVLVGT